MFALHGCYCLFLPQFSSVENVNFGCFGGWSHCYLQVLVSNVCGVNFSLLASLHQGSLPAYPGILVGRFGQGSVPRNPGNIFTAANNPVMQSSAPDVSTLYLLILGFETIIYFVIFQIFAQFAIEK